MTDENNPEPTNNNDDNLLTKFKEIKDNYENKLVDKDIHEGKIAPAQKEKALKLCLRDQEMVTDLYRDAPSIIDIKERKSKKPSPDFMGRLSNYFK